MQQNKFKRHVNRLISEQKDGNAKEIYIYMDRAAITCTSIKFAYSENGLRFEDKIFCYVDDFLVACIECSLVTSFSFLDYQEDRVDL